jgi:hypothetical protein
MYQDHVVPLSQPALAILDKMRDGSQGDLSSRIPMRECFQRMRCSPYRIASAKAQGMGPSKIADVLGIGRASVYRALGAETV